MHLATVLLVAMVTSQASAHGMPIWEMLPRQEKMGQIMYMFMQLVDQTCSFSYMPDCHHVLALHGLTNLVNMDEFTVNRLDPHQTGARLVIWEQVMRGGFDLPPAYLPSYYLGIEAVDEMANEIDSRFPSHPRHPQYQPSSPTFLYPYAAIPNSHNKPQVAVNNPHPYAVKVAPPPGFIPASPSTNNEGKKDNEVTESDSEVRVGNQQQEDDVYVSWSNGDLTEATGDEQGADRIAIWLAEATAQEEQPARDEHAADRFASWFDEETVGNVDQVTGDEQDNFATWLDIEGATETGAEPTEDRFAGWFNEDTTEGEQITEDLYSILGNSESESVEEGNGFTATGSQQTEEDFTVESASTESTERQQPDITDRFASWVDSEAGMEEYNNDMRLSPVGIRPSGDYEPLMVESSVVMSRVPPPVSHVSPMSQIAPASSSSSSSLVLVEEGRKRSTGSRPSLLLLPLPILRQ